MFSRFLRDNATSRRAFDKSELQKIRFIKILDRCRLVTRERSDRIEPNRMAIIRVNDAFKQSSVSRIKPKSIDF